MAETYHPLYLKYRPQSLSDLVGQKSVAQTLTNAIDHNRISHAYLFTGPRGTGKTSSARILAKSLNCESGPTASPCLTCASCLEIKAGNSPSVFELDAASNNSVDDARSLIERAPLVAQGGRYKLYIIDECHMLTKEAFNALLKTIEEPPPMVVFILATTEEHKVPPTIISRCQRLMFKLVNQKELTAHLRHISTLEDINIADEALELIARRSGGGLRDALGLLDQASLLSTKEKPVGVNDLLILLGAVHEDVLLQISDAIQNRDGHAVLMAANTLLMEGREPAVLVLELAKHFLNLTKASYINETGGVSAEALNTLVLGSPSYLQAVAAQAKLFDRAELALMVEYLDKLEQTCRRASQPVLSVEMGLLALCHRHDMTFVKDLDARLRQVESALSDDLPRVPVSAPAAQGRPLSAPAQGRPAPAAVPAYSGASAGRDASAPAARDVAPPQREVAPSPRDAAPPPREASAPPRESAPPQREATPPQRESAPPQRPAATPAREAASSATSDIAAPKAPSLSSNSSVKSKINAAMAAAGLGAPSTAGFKSGGGGGGFPAHVSKVPSEAPPGDMSYDDVEPEVGPGKASPAVQPPVREPSLTDLESQPDVVEEIDDYDIVPRAPQLAKTPMMDDDDIEIPRSSIPPTPPEEEEDQEEDEKPPEPPISTADEEDYNESELNSGFMPQSDPASTQQSSPASKPAYAAEPDRVPVAVPSEDDGGDGGDVDGFWADVKEALQKRHLPTFSIVSVHAYPVSFAGDDFVVGVRNETFQKQLDNKIEHLKAASATVAGRTINVRVKVVADNSPKPAGGAPKTPPARPKEVRSAGADAEEGESRSPQRQTVTPSAEPSGAPKPPPVRPSSSEEIQTRVGGSLINEAYRLFEGPGSRLIGN